MWTNWPMREGSGCGVNVLDFMMVVLRKFLKVKVFSDILGEIVAGRNECLIGLGAAVAFRDVLLVS